MTTEPAVETDELVAEIDRILSAVAEDAMGEYVKIDKVNDMLLDLRLRASERTDATAVP